MSDRTITLVGEFKQSVNIANSLTNGESCSAADFSHAEGYKSYSNGKYSFAGGKQAVANGQRIFVWSGADSNSPLQASGDGTFNIFTNGYNANVDNSSISLRNVKINNKGIGEIIEGSFSSLYSNSSLRHSDNIWSGKNTFGSSISNIEAGVVFNDNRGVGFSSNTQVNFGGQVDFSSNPTAVAPNGSNDKGVVTVGYLGNAIDSYFTDTLTGYVKNDGDSIGPYGDEQHHIYINSSGVVTESTNSIVTMANGASIAGSSLVPVYVSEDGLTPCNGTAGSPYQPVYMSNGSITPISTNAGNSGRKLVYFSSGKITESSLSAGGCGTTSDGRKWMKPVYLNNGNVVPMGDDINIGSGTWPVYVKGGSLVVCDRSIPSGGGGGGGGNSIASINIVGASLKENHFLSQIQGSYDPNTRYVTLTGTMTQPKLTNLSDYDTLEKTYQKILQPTVTGSGNVITSLKFNASGSIEFQREANFFSSIGFEGSGNVIASLKSNGGNLNGVMGTAFSNLTTGTVGNVVSGLERDSNGTAIKVNKVNAMTSIVPAGNRDGNVVSSLYFSGGTLTVTYDNVTSGGGSAISFTSATTPPVEASVASGASATVTINAPSKSGYEVLAVTGVSVQNKDGHGVVFRSFELIGSTLSVIMYNTGDHKHTASVTARFLYIKCANCSFNG